MPFLKKETWKSAKLYLKKVKVFIICKQADLELRINLIFCPWNVLALSEAAQYTLDLKWFPIVLNCSAFSMCAQKVLKAFESITCLDTFFIKGMGTSIIFWVTLSMVGFQR